MMKLFSNKIFRNYFVLTSILFLIEVIFRLVMKISLIDWSLLRVFIGCNIISLAVSLMLSYTGRIASNVIIFIVALIASFYALLQAGFENYIGIFMSIGTSSQAAAVKDYVKDYLDSFLWYYWFILIPIVLLLIYLIFIDKKFVKEDYNFFDRLGSSMSKALSALLIFVGLFYFTLVSPIFQNNIQLKSNTALFTNPDMPNIAVGQFGITTYGLLDVKSTMMPSEEENEIKLEQKKEEEEVTDYTRKIDDSIWLKVNEEETNKNYKNLNNYFLSQKITNKNDYTGVFKDKNLIVIMMESVNNIFLNEEYFPNMHKIYTEGWSYSNAYSPRNSCSTGNNEMSGMTSLFTINNSCTANMYKRNKYPEAMFNLFNNKDYITNSYHNYTEHYYARSTIHPNMGSGHYYGVEELGIPYSTRYEEWPSDVTLMEKVLENIEEDKPFMTWITSVTSHQPYTRPSKYGNLNLDMFKDTDYSISLKRYLSKLKVLDDALGTLLNGLEEKGILKDTVIVLYGDHYPYGLQNRVLNQYFDYDVSVNKETDRTPFVIYNSEIESEEHQEYTTFMNIVPTIANLFDLDYDPRLYTGTDLFSEDYESRAYFADGSWQDEKAYYNATTGKIKYVDENDTYDIEKIQEINNTIDLKIKMSNLAIRTNYFKHLFDSIKEKKVKETATNEDDPGRGSSS